MSRISTESFQQAASLVQAWRRPLLVSHTKPDGDAIGALIAIRRILTTLGASPVAMRFDAIPDRYLFLTEQTPIPAWPGDSQSDSLSSRDAVIILDTCTYNQIEPAAEWLRRVSVPKLAVDHHVTRDDLADQYLIDEQAAATCLILTDWVRALDWPLDPESAVALFVGIATDTGWFRHSNTDDRVFDACAYLVECGVQPHELHERLYQQESIARFRLRAAAMRSMRLLFDGRLAITLLRKSDFADCGAALADTEDLVNEPLRLKSVIVSVMLVEHDDNVVRGGFRSRAPIDESVPDIDVAEIARSFGGGGHRRAAGAKLTGSLTDAHDRILPAVRDAFEMHQ
jgi:bifunctional oligoribonuclease and PAP phosphatase NrnA